MAERRDPEEETFEVLRVSSLTDCDYSHWMENLPNEKQLCPLKDLVIPGSHDSGTFFLDQNMEIGPDEPQMIHNLAAVFGKLAKSVVYSWSVTQTLNIYDQLLAGIRYLDMRVAFRAEDSELRIIHGLYGCPVGEIFDDVKRFNIQYPKEIVILDFNHFYNMDCEAHQRLADTLLGAFGEVLRPPGSDSVNVTLQEMWANEQKVIIFYHEYEVINCYPCFWSSNMVYSPWPNVSDRKQLLEILQKKCLKTDCPDNAFLITQGILTPQTSNILQNMTGTLKDCMAAKCNIHLTGWLKALCGSKYHKFNVIITDFVEIGEFIPTVISMNYFY